MLSTTYMVRKKKNQKLLFGMSITLKLYISDPICVKSKCVWKAYVDLENCKQTSDSLGKFTILKLFLLYYFKVRNANLQNYIGNLWFWSPCNWRQTDPSIKNHYDYHHLFHNSLYKTEFYTSTYLLPVFRVYFVQSEKTRANGESLNDH